MNVLTRAAVLASGDGGQLQAVLDAKYFNEIPDFDLIAVISPEKGSNAMKRALNAGVPAFVVDPELFPNTTSYSMAVANKLRDMDIDLVILAGYDQPLGVVPYQFRNRIIGTIPSLYPAFSEYEGNVSEAVLDRGIRITGATAYFSDTDGRVGPIILQKAIEVLPGDDRESLERRVMEEGEWKVLTQAVVLFCKGVLTVRGNRVFIKESED